MPIKEVMSYEEFVNGMKAHFSPAWFEPYFVIFTLLTLAILFMILVAYQLDWIQIPKSLRKKAVLKPRELEIIHQIIISKGIEKSDGEMLKEIAAELSCNPPYIFLVNKEEFFKILKLVEIRETGKGKLGNKKSKLLFLRNIQRKLFDPDLLS
ncbi:MAG: hypothetical protein HQM10_06280 [Candidatus Riflebacteria bacterium]|nr:hypothetical protein [Candidatus Riflebacteria bacterium]